MKKYTPKPDMRDGTHRNYLYLLKLKSRQPELNRNSGDVYMPCSVSSRALFRVKCDERRKLKCTEVNLRGELKLTLPLCPSRTRASPSAHILCISKAALSPLVSVKCSSF